jgi:predicted MFS family arabinose efflux permease
VTIAVKRTLDSLTVPNYRRYFAGQIVSLTGNWMQMVAEAWLVLKLTHSGADVGITTGLQFLPMLLLGALGGVLIDRVRDKRRLLMLTQTLMAAPAIALWALTAAGAVQVWMVWLIVLLRGTILTVDNPARQTFVMDLVGPDKVVNAVSLNSVIIHSARITGPMFAGALIAGLGVAPCFLFNALSFVAMIVALWLMDPAQLHPQAERAGRERGQVRDAIRTVAARADLRIPLLMMVAIGTFSFNFQVLLPLFAKFTWHGTATTYALLMAAMGVGSITGALAAGHRGRVTPQLLVGAATLFGLGQVLAAAAPTEAIQMAVLTVVGAASVTFAAGVNSSLQLGAGALRGRVMALYSVVFLGSTPIGAPIVGAIAEGAGPRYGLLLGGLAALATALWATIAYRRANAWPQSSSSAISHPATRPHGSGLPRPRRSSASTCGPEPRFSPSGSAAGSRAARG